MKKTIILILLFGFLLSGCARAPRPELIGVKFPEKYMPLDKLCQKYDVGYRWDSLIKKITLTKDGSEVSAIIGTSLLLVDKNPLKINQKVYIKDGKIWLPPAVLRNLYIRGYIEEGKGVGLVPGVLKIKTVLIDPGHGGKDPGAIGRTTGLREKDINLDIARRLKRILNHYGIEVIMTRNRDTFLSLDKRCRIALRSRSDVFISIHTNSSRSRSLRGYEIYYFPDYLNNSKQAKWAVDSRLKPGMGMQTVSLDGLNYKEKMLLWDLIYTAQKSRSIELSKQILRSFSKRLSQRNSGLKTARFHVLKEMNVPCILIEVGYISNAREEALIKEGYYRERIAKAIAEGIVAYNVALRKR